MMLKILYIYVFILFKLITSSSYLERARESLNKGEYYKAIEFYDKAIEEDNTNHLPHYMRGFVYENLRKYEQAKHDYGKAIEIDPNFYKARLNRAALISKQGNLDQAIEDYAYISNNDKGDLGKTASVLMNEIKNLKLSRDQLMDITKKGQYKEAYSLSEKIKEKLQMDISFRKLRCDILEKIGDENAFVDELTRLAMLTPNDLVLTHRVSNSFFTIGKLEEAQIHITRCMSYDPDNSKCKTLFRKMKTVKKLISDIEKNKEASKFDEALISAEKLNKEVPESDFFKNKAETYKCNIYELLGHVEIGMKVCSDLLEKDPNNTQGLLSRSELYLSMEMYDEAKNDVHKILSYDENNHKAKEILNKIERLIKIANKKDYYKILNVSRKATKKEISRSYRKLAKLNHPDHFTDPVAIKQANKKLQELNAAYSVLNDDEKRKLVDQGIDPLDPTENHGGHGNGHYGSHDSFFNFFGGGGNHFGGGGGGHQYHFTFG